MHILYVHQYFKTPEEGGAIRSYYLAKGLVDAGHKVTVLTSHNELTYKKMLVDGIFVHYLPVPYTQNFSKWKRIQAFLWFVWYACRKAPLFKNVDRVYATSTPLTVGLIAGYYRWRYAIPFLFEVRDLWPEAPIQMGVFRNRWLQRYLRRWEKRIYQQAEALVALSPDIERHIRRIVPHKPIYLIPNMADCQFFRKSERNIYHEVQFEVENKFVVTYFGAIGKVNQLDYLLDAAEACQRKGLAEVQFLVVGQGSELPHLKKSTEERAITNITFVDHQNKYGLLSVLNITDALYISFANHPVLQAGSPNKFFDALAAGKMCITNTAGWIAQLIEDNHCGFYAPPQYPEKLVAQLAPFVTDRTLLEICQRNARDLAEREFSREKQVTVLRNILEPSRPPVEATACTSLV
ncbi:glycosyltransferase family 4 protein [Tunicatimonas pelagia]|uniref:glycosyltransferase family 4 protein n=1 Tax=Tunicatimonas pelagia TaxID=931531 RepID=UPI002666A328|nr:glycosyltransferase family 4 protein [Tunicatimonas pelagia]WKN40455.1 glycosyltransferase family 4 protein [Tunicatimonas pelagia]